MKLSIQKIVLPLFLLTASTCIFADASPTDLNGCTFTLNNNSSAGKPSSIGVTFTAYTTSGRGSVTPYNSAQVKPGASSSISSVPCGADNYNAFVVYDPSLIAPNNKFCIYSVNSNYRPGSTVIFNYPDPSVWQTSSENPDCSQFFQVNSY